MQEVEFAPGRAASIDAIKPIRWIALVAGIIGCAQVAVAQQPRPVEFPPAPHPSECIVAPVREEALRTLPVRMPATPLATPAVQTADLSLFPTLGSVEWSTRLEIAALQQQFSACVNAGDTRRALNLLTRSYLARIVAASGDQVLEYFPAEPEPRDALDWDSAYVSDVRQADDGRLIAYVYRCDGDQIVYYRQEDQEWRIDDSVDVPVDGVVACGAAPIPTEAPVP